MKTDEPIVAESGPSFAISVADEVWIAAALLHREHPDREAFSAREISERARREAITPRLRPGVYVHAIQHCVANRPPNPSRLRMLFATSRSQRRLFRPGDPSHPQRTTARSLPDAGDLPPRYRPLLAWYAAEYAAEHGVRRDGGADPLLRLRGSGRQLWREEPADDYVERLRRGWK